MRCKKRSLLFVIISLLCVLLTCKVAESECTTDVVIFIDQSPSMLSGPQGNRPIDLALNSVEVAFAGYGDDSPTGRPRVSIFTFRDKLFQDVPPITDRSELKARIEKLRAEDDGAAGEKSGEGTNLVEVAKKIVALQGGSVRTFFVIASDFVHAPGRANNGVERWDTGFGKTNFSDSFLRSPRNSLLLLFFPARDESDGSIQRHVMEGLKTCAVRSMELSLKVARALDISQRLNELRRPLKLTVTRISMSTGPDYLEISMKNDSCEKEVRVESLEFRWPMADDIPEYDSASIPSIINVPQNQPTLFGEYITAVGLLTEAGKSRRGESRLPINNQKPPKKGTVVARAGGLPISDEVPFTFRTWYELTDAQVFINAGVVAMVLPTVRGDIVTGKVSSPQIDLRLMVGKEIAGRPGGVINARDFKPVSDSSLKEIALGLNKKYDFCGRRPPEDVRLALQVGGGQERSIPLVQENPSDHEPRRFVEPLLIHGLVFVGLLLPVILSWRRPRLKEFAEILEIGAAIALVTFGILDAGGSLGRQIEAWLLSRWSPQVLGSLFFLLLGVLLLVCFWRGLFEDESIPRSLWSLRRRLLVRLGLGIAVLALFVRVSRDYWSNSEAIGSCTYKSDIYGMLSESSENVTEE